MILIWTRPCVFCEFCDVVRFWSSFFHSSILCAQPTSNADPLPRLIATKKIIVHRFTVLHISARARARVCVYISFYVVNVMCISTFVQVLKMNGKSKELKYPNKKLWMMNMYEYKLDYLNRIFWNNRNICTNEHDTTVFPSYQRMARKYVNFVIFIYLDRFQFF